MTPGAEFFIIFPDAFDDRREYITNFYLQKNDHLDREYPYLTEAEAEAFVVESVSKILAELEKYTAHC